MGDRPAKVLFIAGTGRGGSTLLANILGQVDTFECVGEMHHVWRRGILDNWQCGCGEPFCDCPLWRKVVPAEIADDRARVEGLLRDQEDLLRLRHAPALLAASARRDRRDPRVASVAAVLGDLYERVAEVSGCDVIVDSSKLPAYGWLLATQTPLDVRVVHLVRDPRAVAFSWQRRVLRTDTGVAKQMNMVSPSHSALTWLAENVLIERYLGGDASRYVRVRYEDLVAEPRPVVAQLLRLVDSDAAVPVTADGAVELSPTHTVSGNPSRMSYGRVEIAPDDEWADRMPGRDRSVVTAIAAPLLRRYGYPLRPRRD